MKKIGAGKAEVELVKTPSGNVTLTQGNDVIVVQRADINEFIVDLLLECKF